MVSLTNFWVAPDACTLPTAEQPLRVAEFDALFAEHLLGVDRVTPTLLVLTLAGRPGPDGKVRELTDRESSCCSFFTFAISTDEPVEPVDDVVHVRLEIAVPVARVDVLDALAHRAAAARQPERQ